MKKKYELFKVLFALLFLVVVTTYFVKGRNGEVQYLALFDVFFDFLQSFYYFFDTLLYIAVVGGFYGLLNKIPAYRMFVQSLVGKIGEKKKLFVIITTVVFAILSSLTGLNVILFLLVPFFVTVILLLGYDKLVALSTTVGGIIVGLIGGVFVTFKDSSNQYAVSYSTFEDLVGLNSKWNLSTTLPKVLLLVIGVVLLIFYVMSYIKKEKYFLIAKGDALFVEVKDKSSKKGTKAWPLLLVCSIMLILLILGYLPWNSLFGISVFDDFHTWLTGISVAKFHVFTSLFSSMITAFGTWGNVGTCLIAVFLICFFSLILMLIYRVKFDDAMDGFFYGVKKMIVPVVLIALAYAVLVTSYNNGFIETIIKQGTKAFGDNVVGHFCITFLGSILNVDLYYSTAGVFSSIVSSLTEKANLSVFAVMFQSVYGLVQLVGPTSILLIAGLSYLEVPYKSWLKYIWRFCVQLLIVIFIVLMGISLI